MPAAVSSLGYVELGVGDLSAWRSYGEDVLGLAGAVDGDALTLRMDGDRWRIRAVESGEDDVRALGLEISDRAALDEIRARLESQGVEVSAGTDAECRARGVESLYACADPDGLRVELYLGDRSADGPFVSPCGVSGFVTGNQGFGHLVVMVGDKDKADCFFQEGLGFRLSDYIVLGRPGRQVTLTFLHCNPRHHTLAYVPAPAPKRLNHLMLQTRSIDDVGRALDRANERGVPIVSSLGRHTNDRMISFYMRTPSGFDVEYGYGGVEVDDAEWTVTTYDATSIWGHKR